MVKNKGNNSNKWLKPLLLLLLLSAGIFLFHKLYSVTPNQPVPTVEAKIAEDGQYSSKEDVALYIHTYHKLPSNFVTKKEAKKMGWVSSKGNLRVVCEGCSIGGDIFTNTQKVLPVKKGRVYYECDIDYEGGKRNAKRIVFSDDGLIFYTPDHYNSFEQLYGEEQ